MRGAPCAVCSHLLSGMTLTTLYPPLIIDLHTLSAPQFLVSVMLSLKSLTHLRDTGVNASLSVRMTEMTLKWSLLRLLSPSQKYEHGGASASSPERPGVAWEVGLRDEEQRTQGLGVAGADCKGGGTAKAGGSQTVRITELDHKCPRVWP